MTSGDDDRSALSDLSDSNLSDSDLSDSNFCDVTLHLERIEQLFQPPELDPFAGRHHTLSGIEEILNKLKPRSSNCQVRTTILLPQDHLTENLEQSCHAAIQGYCEAKIHHITNDMITLRRQGLRALQVGLFLLAVCLLSSTFVNQIEMLPEFLRQLLSEGFVITGWVGLWYSIELLLFERRLYRREKHLYQRIQAMKLSIKAALPES